MPQREKEIMHLKGEEVIESDQEDQDVDDEDDKSEPQQENSDEEDDEMKDQEDAKNKSKKEGKEPAGKAKGDADSSSEEEEMDDEAKMMRGDLTAEEAQRIKTRKQTANAKLKKEIE